MTFGFNLVVAEAGPGVEERLWSEIERASRSDAVAAYVAHMCIRQLDWQIRHHPQSVELWLDQAKHVRQLLA